MMENKYYVYIYLNPIKNGKFIYDEYCFDFEPFYIGKGSGYRFISHLKKYVNAKCNKHKMSKINKIIKEGFEPIIIKVCDNLNEKDSFLLEKKLIRLIGREDLGEGPLTNKTDGGEGINNIFFTEERKKLLSKRFSGEKNPMYGKGHLQRGEKNHMWKIGDKHFLYGEKRSSETIDKISKNHHNVKGSLNPNSKITEWDVKIMRKFFEFKKDKIKKVIIYKTISKKYNISESNSKAICLNKTWKNV